MGYWQEEVDELNWLLTWEEADDLNWLLTWEEVDELNWLLTPEEVDELNWLLTWEEVDVLNWLLTWEEVDELSKSVTWCFTPSQPVQLYQGNRRFEDTDSWQSVSENYYVYMHHIITWGKREAIKTTQENILHKRTQEQKTGKHLMSGSLHAATTVLTPLDIIMIWRWT